MDAYARQSHTHSNERDRIAALRDEIERSATRIYPAHPPAPQQPMVQPPTYGAPQRDAINSLVDKVVGDVCDRIVELKKQLDALQQQILVGGAATKVTLNEQIDACMRVNDETTRIGDAVGEIADRLLRL
ncbi:hypothetical protein M2232_002336 [Bradyrhizobium japonicum]|uniref:hypothetical protein n=1 Tax=Bradyrhizobium japonicum TaxID=375 RepID=UPI0022272FB9|nr:hypothetical protein [Bradyrhizobium japonicum]MCW2218804.1 hypothetical protein [Bradyrhizobium japonicum]MCW2343418.1 hypothetical protein [Bradyrhizobium japonicum]